MQVLHFRFRFKWVVCYICIYNVQVLIVSWISLLYYTLFTNLRCEFVGFAFFSSTALGSAREFYVVVCCFISEYLVLRCVTFVFSLLLVLWWALFV